MKLIISRDVLEQLDEIYDFLAKKSPAAAAETYHRLVDKMETLAERPLIAPAEILLDDRPEGFRSLVVGKTHKIIYFIADQTVQVVAVWDCRRNPDRNRQTALKK